MTLTYLTQNMIKNHKNILIVGKGSFIGVALYNNFNLKHNCSITAINHTEINSVVFSNYDVVINCALHPSFKTQKYNEELDIDLHLARSCFDKSCTYIMLSSRQVYGIHDNLLTLNESSPINPNTFYGENKSITEEKIKNISINYVILRGSNIFGFEYGRRSFMGFCLNQLKDTKKIIYDLDQHIIRDFIHIDIVCDIIWTVIEKNTKGIFNLGSGVGLDVGSIAKWIIHGYGLGEFVCTSTLVKDQFILDSSKIYQELEKNNIIFDFENIFKSYGEQLCKI